MEEIWLRGNICQIHPFANPRLSFCALSLSRAATRGGGLRGLSGLDSSVGLRPHLSFCQESINRVFRKRCVLTKTAKMTTLHSTTENKGFAPQTPETTKMTKMAAVTQAKAWFRKSRCVLPRFCVLLGTFPNFWGFPDFWGIFPICPFPLSRPVLKHVRGGTVPKGSATHWTFAEKSGKPPGLETPRRSPGLASLKSFSPVLRNSQARTRHININFLVRLLLGRPRECPRDKARFSPDFTQ